LDLKYLAKKIYNKIEIYKIKKYEIADNLYLVNTSKEKIKSILFYFPDHQFMHFGDHLFFEPLARELQNVGYKVYVLPIKTMEFYFKTLGFIIGDDILLESVDLVLTKVEFIPKLLHLNNQILFTDTATSDIESPLCLSLINKVFTYLGENSSDCCDMPSTINSYSLNINQQIDKEKKYILFNNYIDSGFFRSGVKHQKMIIDCVKKIKINTDYCIIHTGSEKDKKNDLDNYDFVDIDLRGKTSIEDMFYLSSLKNVIYNVSFDCFQMHLFFIINKKSFILFRGRYLKKNDNYIRKYVLPPFSYKGKLSDLIEYIE